MFSLETWDFILWGANKKKDILGKLDIILSIVLYCIVLYCTVLYYILLYCFFILFYFLIQYNNDYTHLDIWTNVFVGTDYSINMTTCQNCAEISPEVLYCTKLYCIVFYCIVLYCTELYCTILYCTVVYCITLNCSVLYICSNCNRVWRPAHQLITIDPLGLQ